MIADADEFVGGAFGACSPHGTPRRNARLPRRTSPQCGRRGCGRTSAPIDPVRATSTSGCWRCSPGSRPRTFCLGTIARDEGDTDLARREFTAALAAAPDYVDARLAAVRAATAQRDDAAAIALCEEGLARMPANVALLRALGHAHLARRDGAAAAAAFGRALAAEPADADTHYNHGVALQMGRSLR